MLDFKHKDDSQSQSDYVFWLNGGPMSWERSKQKLFVNSTVEVSLLSFQTYQKFVWIKKFITKLGTTLSIMVHINLYYSKQMSPFCNLKSLDFTNSPNTYLGVMTSLRRMCEDMKGTNT